VNDGRKLATKQGPAGFFSFLISFFRGLDKRNVIGLREH
jgi:hypothetical protein